MKVSPRWRPERGARRADGRCGHLDLLVERHGFQDQDGRHDLGRGRHLQPLVGVPRIEDRPGIHVHEDRRFGGDSRSFRLVSRRRLGDEYGLVQAGAGGQRHCRRQQRDRNGKGCGDDQQPEPGPVLTSPRSHGAGLRYSSTKASVITTGIHRDVAVRTFRPGLDLGDGVNDAHALDDFAKHGVAPPLRASSPCGSRKPLSFRLMKNWLLALWGSDVRAIATVPRSFFRPLSASFVMGAAVGFCLISSVNPPPWIMNAGITRWNIGAVEVAG